MLGLLALIVTNEIASEPWLVETVTYNGIYFDSD
jgi:hypothetical protein